MRAQADGGRLKEILGILSRHQLARGLTPEKLRAILEELGPTFVKLGQIMSMRRDMLPEAYCLELGKLRSEASPMPFPQVKALIEEEFQQDLEKMFSSFSHQPLGSASIAQVHSAALPDGTRVVVKVQRPGIRETMSRDIQLLRRAAGPIRYTDLGGVLDWEQLLDELWAVTQQELDFLTEAKNAQEFRDQNRNTAFFACPRVIHTHSCERVLVMEYMDGIPADRREELEKAGCDPAEIGRTLAGQYMKQVIDHGFFQADPHPGNLLIRGRTVVWLDLGMMGRLSPRDQQLIREGVAAFTEDDVDRLRGVVLGIGVCREPVDRDSLNDDLRELMDRYGSAPLDSIDLGEVLEALLSLAKSHHISIPPGISLLGRGIVTLEGTLAALSPELNLLEILKGRVKAEAFASLDWGALLEEEGWKLLTSGRKAAALAGQTSDLVRTALKGQARVNVHLAGRERETARLEALGNRLIRCLLCCALVVGGCLLCTAPLSPAPLGIPVPAWVCFALAAGLGGELLWSMRPKK